MSNGIAVLIVIAVFFFLLLTGHYMSTLLYTVGMVGILLIHGPNMLSGFLINEQYKSVATYSLTTIPLYVLMAQFITKSGIISDFYALAYKLSGGRRTVLGVLTQVMGAFLGAVCGSSTATAAALGQVAVPELRAKGYSDELAGAVAASAGTLSAIIPPSVVIIIFGTAAEVSIGKLFMAAFIPGIIVCAVYSACTVWFLKFSKREKMLEEQQKEHVQSQIKDLPLQRVITLAVIGVILVVTIFGGIYSGVFTPTEAGAIGAFLAFLSTLAIRAMDLQKLKDCIAETVKVTCMTMMMIMSASLFGRFVTLSKVPNMLMNILEPIMNQRVLVLAIILVVYYLLFMFIDGGAAILLSMPVLRPLMVAMNVDLVWFGVFVTVLCAIGSLTPPVGMGVYAVGGVTKIPIGRIFAVAMRFALVAAIVAGGLLILFPAVATYLPSRMI